VKLKGWMRAGVRNIHLLDIHINQQTLPCCAFQISGGEGEEAQTRGQTTPQTGQQRVCIF